MIQLSYLDYLAVEGKSGLHRLSPKVKIIGLAVVLLGIVTLRNLPALLLLYADSSWPFFHIKSSTENLSSHALPSHLCHSLHFHFRISNLFYPSRFS